MKIYWNGDSKNIIGPKLKELREKQVYLKRHLQENFR